jgi:hypothetical protein
VNGPFDAPWQADWAFGYGYPFYTFYAPLDFMQARCSTSSWVWIRAPQTKLSFYSSLYLSRLLMYALDYVRAIDPY